MKEQFDFPFSMPVWVLLGTSGYSWVLLGTSPGILRKLYVTPTLLDVRGLYEGGAAHMTSPEFIHGFFEQPSHSSPGGSAGRGDTSVSDAQLQGGSRAIRAICANLRKR